jgi:hypothetical protein
VHVEHHVYVVHVQQDGMHLLLISLFISLIINRTSCERRWQSQRSRQCSACSSCSTHASHSACGSYRESSSFYRRAHCRPRSARGPARPACVTSSGFSRHDRVGCRSRRQAASSACRSS